MEDWLQKRLQIPLDDFLGDSVGDRRHTPGELHYIPADLWDRPRSSTHFIRYEGSNSLF